MSEQGGDIGVVDDATRVVVTIDGEEEEEDEEEQEEGATTKKKRTRKDRERDAVKVSQRKLGKHEEKLDKHRQAGVELKETLAFETKEWIQNVQIEAGRVACRRAARIASVKAVFSSVFTVTKQKPSCIIATVPEVAEAYAKVKQALIDHFVKCRGTQLPDSYPSEDLSAVAVCCDRELSSFELARFSLCQGKFSMVLRWFPGFGLEDYRDLFLEDVALPYDDYADAFPASAAHNRDAEGTFPLWHEDMLAVMERRRKEFVAPFAVLCDDTGHAMTDLDALFAAAEASGVFSSEKNKKHAESYQQHLDEEDKRVLFQHFLADAKAFMLQCAENAKSVAKAYGNYFIEPAFLQNIWQSAPQFDYWAQYTTKHRF
jgi:hypothetical protein